MPTLEWILDLPVSQQALWDFHADPVAALPALTPPSFAMELVDIDHPYGLGARLTMRTRIFPGIWRPWIARIIAFDPPHGFVDVAEHSPFKAWRHEHVFEDLGTDRCRLIDRVTYQVPLGRLGTWVDPVLVRPKLRAMFQYRHRVTAASVV